MENSSNKLPVIQSLWIGDELSPMEQLCASSFLKNGHSFHLYTYDEVKNVPAGVVLKDASELIGHDKIFKYKKRDTYSGFANMFRYKLLLEKGDFWVDTDVVCLRPFDSCSDYIFAKSRRTEASGGPYGNFDMENCVIKTPPGSSVMEYCYEESMRRDPKKLVFCETGPDLLEIAVKKFKLDKYLVRAETFCPINWPEWHKFLSDSPLVTWIEMMKMILYQTKGVHLWNEMWRLNGVKKDALFPESCIFERLKKRYLYNGINNNYKIKLDQKA
jgi:hypothetical protein